MGYTGRINRAPSMNQYLAELAEQLNNVERLLMNDSGWVKPPLLNSWTEYYEPIGYRRVAGRVYLRGVFHPGASLKAAFTLPKGFRPAAGALFGGAAYPVSAVSVAVDISGEVAPIYSGSPEQVSIDGIEFFTN